MLRSSVTPAGRETDPDPAGAAVSETDLEGRISFVNKAFLRTSGFAEAELLGQPHDIINHPDMPRSIFGQMWEKVCRGQEVFLYMQSRAKDGSAYWELAHVAPRLDAQGRVAGCRSVRRQADADEVAEIAPFYRRIRDLETAAERLPQPSTPSPMPPLMPQRETDDGVADAA